MLLFRSQFLALQDRRSSGFSFPSLIISHSLHMSTANRKHRSANRDRMSNFLKPLVEKNRIAKSPAGKDRDGTLHRSCFFARYDLYFFTHAMSLVPLVRGLGMKGEGENETHVTSVCLERVATLAEFSNEPRYRIIGPIRVISSLIKLEKNSLRDAKPSSSYQTCEFGFDNR